MAEHDVAVSLGSYLRALREARQRSLEEMARATRVSVHQLEALECGSFSELPAPVFVKGFVRAYCQFLGESPDEALGRYCDMLGERPATKGRPPAERSAPAWSGSPIFISLVLLVVFGFGLLAVNLGFRRGPALPDLGPGAKAPSPAAIPPGPGATPAPPVAAADATAGSPTVQRLLVKALEATWIRIQPDDRGAVEELLPPGATRQWTAEKRFLLTVGNAGGIEIELNGRPMPPLGARGAVIRQLELPRAAAAGS
jgi:transcriptional regulator with XRE-family HTH domain